MDIETIGMIGAVGFAFVAAPLARAAYERHMDVLYGPYIEGRNSHPRLGWVLKPQHAMINRLRRKMRKGRSHFNHGLLNATAVPANRSMG